RERYTPRATKTAPRTAHFEPHAYQTPTMDASVNALMNPPSLLPFDMTCCLCRTIADAIIVSTPSLCGARADRAARTSSAQRLTRSRSSDCFIAGDWRSINLSKARINNFQVAFVIPILVRSHLTETWSARRLHRQVKAHATRVSCVCLLT